MVRLFPEINWVNSLQEGRMPSTQPRLLAPVANLLRDRLGEAVITPSSTLTSTSMVEPQTRLTRRALAWASGNRPGRGWLPASSRIRSE